MTVRTLAAAAVLAAAVATPAFAQGLDSRHSPYPADAYSGFVGTFDETLPEQTVTHFRSPAYRYSGPHAGCPANALRRY